MDELNRRLGSPELAQDLPGTLLMKVAMDYVKHLEARNAIERAKLEQVKLDPLEMIDQPGLSLAHRINILHDYIDDVEEAWRAASVRIEALLEEARRDPELNPALVSEVQEVVSSE